jgi:hypothetical protein
MGTSSYILTVGALDENMKSYNIPIQLISML